MFEIGTRVLILGGPDGLEHVIGLRVKNRVGTVIPSQYGSPIAAHIRVIDIDGMCQEWHYSARYVKAIYIVSL